MHRGRREAAARMSINFGEEFTKGYVLGEKERLHKARPGLGWWWWCVDGGGADPRNFVFC